MKLEEVHCLQEENRDLRGQVAQRDARIQYLEMMLEQQQLLMHQQQEQLQSLTQQVTSLQERQAKDSHNRSLPPLF